MKLGLVTSILDNKNMFEVVNITSKIGFECLEVACWPKGNAERRYAGVTHLDVNNLDISEIEEINRNNEKNNISIASLAYYPNTMSGNLEQRKVAVNHLYSLIDNVHVFGTDLITTFIGRDQNKTVEENLELVKEIWIPIIRYAETKNVRIAIENCPMYFGRDQWPGGQNLMVSPKIWRVVFEILNSKNIGINYDPSHFIWQQIDYLKPLKEFKDKIFHVHCKDIKLYKDKLDDVGILSYPLDYMAPKLPGLGDVNWGKFISSLRDIGYDGNICIEIEDKSFEGSEKQIIDSLELSYRYLRQYII